MTRRTTVISVIGFLFSLLLLIPATAAERQSKASNDDAAQLKAALDERIKVLTQLVDVVTSQYQAGVVDSTQLFSAANALCGAQLDATEDPEKRIALLTKQVDKASDILKLVQARHDAGTVTDADVLRAKSLCLGLKIKLLRERKRKSPQMPATGAQTKDERGKVAADQRQELAELKQLASEISARLDKMERRLSQMEE